MKKFATILVLVFVLSVSTFADGEILIGNRNCPQGQTCFADGDILIGNSTEDTVFENIFDFLKSIF